MSSKPKFKVGDRVATAYGEGVIADSSLSMVNAHFSDYSRVVQYDDGSRKCLWESSLQLVEKIEESMSQTKFKYGDRVALIESGSVVQLSADGAHALVRVCGEYLWVDKNQLRMLSGECEIKVGYLVFVEGEVDMISPSQQTVRIMVANGGAMWFRNDQVKLVSTTKEEAESVSKVEFKVGDRVATASGLKGVIIEQQEPEQQQEPEHDPVKRPSHYCVGGYECRDVIEALGLGYYRGNAFKYLWRAGRKGDAIEDLRKAARNIEYEIERLEKEKITNGQS